MSDEHLIPIDFRNKIERAGFNFVGDCMVCGGNPAWKWEFVRNNYLYVITLKKNPVIQRKPEIKFTLKYRGNTTLGPLNTVDQVLQANGF